LLIQQWPRDRVAWIGIYVRLVFGIGFIATTIGVSVTTAYGDYLTSGMMLPTLVIVLILISTTLHYVELTFSFYGLCREYVGGKEVSEGGNVGVNTYYLIERGETRVRVV
jgi:hypothetical protein